METERLKNQRKDSGALHFELVCDKSKVFDHLISLRSQAQDRVARVSQIFRLCDDECLVDGPEDPLLDVKLMSQRLVLHKNKIAIANPETINFFAIQLHNGATTYFGFATYPKSIIFDNELVDIPYQNKAYWSCFVLMNRDFDDSSYKDILCLIRFLKTLGVQVEMNKTLCGLR